MSTLSALGSAALETGLSSVRSPQPMYRERGHRIRRHRQAGPGDQPEFVGACARAGGGIAITGTIQPGRATGPSSTERARGQTSASRSQGDRRGAA